MPFTEVFEGAQNLPVQKARELLDNRFTTLGPLHVRTEEPTKCMTAIVLAVKQFIRPAFQGLIDHGTALPVPAFRAMERVFNYIRFLAETGEDSLLEKMRDKQEFKRFWEPLYRCLEADFRGALFQNDIARSDLAQIIHFGLDLQFYLFDLVPQGIALSLTRLALQHPPMYRARYPGEGFLALPHGTLPRPAVEYAISIDKIRNAFVPGNKVSTRHVMMARHLIEFLSLEGNIQQAHIQILKRQVEVKLCTVMVDVGLHIIVDYFLFWSFVKLCPAETRVANQLTSLGRILRFGPLVFRPGINYSPAYVANKLYYETRGFRGDYRGGLMVPNPRAVALEVIHRYVAEFNPVTPEGMFRTLPSEYQQNALFFGLGQAIGLLIKHKGEADDVSTMVPFSEVLFRAVAGRVTLDELRTFAQSRGVVDVENEVLKPMLNIREGVAFIAGDVWTYLV
jgi:hypothetical protein